MSRLFPTTLALALLVLAASCKAPEDYSVDPATTGSYPDQAAAGSWRQWGGPTGDFKVGGVLAESWPEAGPPLLWSRPLGAGYSAIAAKDGALFTMYHEGDEDVVVAMRADDGSEIWSHRYAAGSREGNVTDFGVGPNATPLVLDDRLVTLGYAGMLHCLETATGELLWSHDLIGEFGGAVIDFGYSASPIFHEGKIIVLVGGEAQGAVAFAPDDGAVVWKSRASSVSYATPLVIDVGGQDQLIYFSDDEVIAVDAGDGEFLWSRPCLNQYSNNATGALWGDDGLLWVATQLDGGTRVLRPTLADGQTDVEELWFSNKIGIHYWNSLRIGDHVYASIGGQASILAGIDIKTGDIVWRERGFTQANLVQADNATVLLDGNGQLALIELTPEGLTVKSQVEIIDGETWTPPTLIDTTLYIRDGKSIRALDLG